MKFDELNNVPCVLPQPGDASCTVAPPPVNEDAQLVLRPEVAVVEVLGNVQYRTFVIANGVEMEVTSGLAYTSANYQIAVIGAIGGSATGVAEGIVTIGVTWQGLEAFAQLQVVASCDSYSTGMMVVIDRSESMSQAFGGAYGTKLDFAKLLAKQFIGEVNVLKDTVGLVQFGADAQVLEPLTDDNVAVATTLMGVQHAPVDTDITSGLQAAIDNLTGVDRRVIVLLTDGGHNDDAEPIALAQQFRSGGGLIVVVALRAGVEAFMRCEKIASGGFLISAYDGDTALDAKGYMSGVKGYFCAGNCCPEGDEFVASGQLNYTGWQNWDVVAGRVDLIGKGFYDLIPGNGLYMDLVGSSAPWQGFVQTKRTFTFEAGHNYRLTYKLAGNQRENAVPFNVRIMAGGIVNTLRGMNDWRQNFTTYTETFAGDNTTGKIGFLQESIPGQAQAQSFGNLLDCVCLEDTTDGVILFKDDFDRENLTFIPPQCGMGTMYGYGGDSYGYPYGYCCYGYGCLAEPIKAQHPDPNPPAEIEMDNPPPTFTSTQSYTASCPGGTTGPDVTRQATYTSLISMADAITRALALAQAAAEADLDCRQPPVAGELINVETSVGNAFEAFKSGIAATGFTPNDFWNFAASYDTQIKNSSGSFTQAALTKVPVIDFASPEPGTGFVAYSYALLHNDEMYQKCLSYFAADGLTPKPVGYAVYGLEPGTYAVYVYAHGPAITETSEVHVRTGELIGNPGTGWTWDTGTDTDWGVKEPGGADYLSAAWIENANFVKFTVTVGAGQDAIFIQFGPGDTGDVFSNGFQIQRLT